MTPEELAQLIDIARATGTPVTINIDARTYNVSGYNVAIDSANDGRPLRQRAPQIADRDTLLALPVPSYYTIEQRQAYLREQQRRAQLESDLDARAERAARYESEERAATQRRLDEASRLR